MYPAGGTDYGLSALKSESDKIAKTEEGSRNNSLWLSGCRIGELIGGGELSPELAVKKLMEAAAKAGLRAEEANRVLTRPDGALLQGISSPRNRYGSLGESYLSAVCDPRHFKDFMDFWHPLDWWYNSLDSNNPSWKALELLSQIATLGVIYRSNYVYFLARIHLLVLSKERGTKVVFEVLDSLYRRQADEHELMFLETNANLSLVVANQLPRELEGLATIVDFQKMAEDLEAKA